MNANAAGVAARGSVQFRPLEKRLLILALVGLAAFAAKKVTASA